MYNLRAKNVEQIILQRQGFTISNQTLEQTADLHLILRFRRQFDDDFALNTVTVRPVGSAALWEDTAALQMQHQRPWPWKRRPPCTSSCALGPSSTTTVP